MNFYLKRHWFSFVKALILQFPFFIPLIVKGPFPQMSNLLMSVNYPRNYFCVKKFQLLLGWTSGVFCCKAKGLKLLFLSNSKFFTQKKYYFFGIENWRFANFGPILCSILIFLHQICYQFWTKFPNFIYLFWVKKIKLLKNNNFGPLLLQQKKPKSIRAIF